MVNLNNDLISFLNVINYSRGIKRRYVHRINRTREKTINEALEMTDALHLKKRLFHSLSGGERQRVSLSRCLAQNSPLILLDEPSSFLDRESRDSFISLMEKVATPERAIIAITHDSTVIDRLGWKEVALERRRDDE